MKALVDRAAAQLRVGGRAATVQIWTKVTSSVLTLPAGAGSRRTVLKRRRLRKFDTSGETAREIPLGAGQEGEDPLSGTPECNVEWTTVEVPNVSKCWTFGLEALGFAPGVDPRVALVGSLKATVAALDASMPGRPELDAAWIEQSYPAWLVGA